MSVKKFLIVFIPYVLVSIGYIVYEIEIANNVDVKGWWPLALILTMLFHGIVSVAYYIIDRLSPSSYRYTAIYGVLFALPFAIIVINEAWNPVNWYAVNTGEVQLTISQAMTNSALYLPVMAGLILLSHFIIRWSARSKSGR